MPIPQLHEPQFRIRQIGARVVRRVQAVEQRRKRHFQKWPRWKRILVRTLIGCAIAGGLGVIFLISAFAWYSRDLPDPNKIMSRSIAQSTQIYARDGTTLLYEIHGSEKRTLMQIEDIPKIMQQATVAIEDQDFYKHQGFDLGGIIKAGCHEAFGNLAGLCPTRGGSTITQQFVKNAILTSERSYTRKIKELVLSYQIEKKFTKDQILQLYFNEIPFGSTLYGVEAAAQSFLGKSVKDVTLSEAAFLAAIPQRPTYLSPYGSHTDELSARLHTVLNKMVELGYITKEQAAEAKKDNILERMRPQYENITAPHFVMYVRELLSNTYGEKMVEQGGLKVITTLNIDKQRAAEESINKYAGKNADTYQASNAALVSLDTKTGQILAMVGSRDYFDESIDGNVNVTLRPRQPGSSFKPIVYLTAFMKGYTPDTLLFDLVTSFKTGAKDYSPKNYDLQEHGPVTMRQALAGSLNIPAVKTLYLAGIDNVLDTAASLGYSTFGDRSRFGLSLVLGGGEVTLLEHTAAFASLAREGVYHPPASILRVEDNTGKVLEEFKDREERAVDEKYVRMLTSVLSDNGARAYIFGSRNYLTLSGRPVAAKTGTTNDYRDAWTLGYTPSIATGVWVGNNDNSEMRRGADGSIVAAPIWHDFMQNTVGGPVEPFKAAPANDADKPVLRGELQAETKFKVDSVTGKLIPESCLPDYPSQFIVEKTFRAVHDILYYVNKDNPRGPAPADPAADPQYERWEEPVRRWAAQNNYTESMPAPGDCSLRSAENQPSITITAPKNGAAINSKKFTATAAATSPRTIKKVVFFIDSTVAGTVTKKPYSLSIDVSKTEKGFHDLKAVVYDDIDNSSSATVTINVRSGVASIPKKTSTNTE
ncbi:MAG: penicillin-binding protein [Patescibacteria group bacterium]|nr:penicillin-binding protein [Patescibacteria group bacterium]MDD5715975.1 penicillin-binding protein [Patescibacteria group bacterium]